MHAYKQTYMNLEPDGGRGNAARVVRVSQIRARGLPSHPRLFRAGRLFSRADPYAMVCVRVCVCVRARLYVCMYV